MTREELREHCLKQIEGCEMWARCKGEEPHGKIYEEHKLILELLEQETVSKESYDHEYFLRKELEMKITKLEHDKNKVLDKIRAEITAIAINGQVDEHTMFIRAGGEVKRMALDIIDKYKAESEK